MDWWSLLTVPAVVAAGVSGVISVVGLIVSTWTARGIHTEKLAFDRDIAERKFAADIDLAERKFDSDRDLAKKKLVQDQALAMWKRRSELAEIVLADCYRVQSVLTSLSGRTEMEFLIKKEECSDIAQVSQYVWNSIERVLKKERDLFDNLRAKYNTSSVLLGKDIDDAFRAVAWADITIERRCLYAGDGSLRDPKASDGYAFIERVSSWIGQELLTEVNEAIEKIEAICRSVLDVEV